MASEHCKATANISKKRWADMCAALVSRFGDTDQTRAAIQDIQNVFHYDPQATTSSEAQRQRVRELRRRHKVILAAAASCPECSSHTHAHAHHHAAQTRASETEAT